MKRNVSLQTFYLLGHLVMSLYQILRVLRLVFQLSRQLVVLQDSESRLRLKLLVIECHQVGLSLLHFEVHLLCQLLHVLDLLELGLVDANHALTLISLILYFELSDFSLQIFLSISHRFLFLEPVFFFGYFMLQILQVFNIYLLNFGDFNVLAHLRSFIQVFLSDSLALKHPDGHILFSVRLMIPF